MRRMAVLAAATGGFAVTSAPALAIPNLCSPESFPGTLVAGNSVSDSLTPPDDTVDCFLFQGLSAGNTFSFLFHAPDQPLFGDTVEFAADVYDGLTINHLGGPATFEFRVDTNIGGIVPTGGELVTRIMFTSASTPTSNFSEGYSVTLTTQRASVPEPASIALFGVALAGLGLSRRSARRRQTH